MNSTNQQKRPIYFPSLSAGAYSQGIKKNSEVAPGVTYRFWEDTTPEEWRHKAFLITGGHYYKKMTVRKDWGLDNGSVVFGDSGGFQIAKGTIKWDIGLRDQIFNWLEENSDVAANLDIPTRGTYLGRFQEAMDFSIDNFKYFESKQSGKTKFLTVLQGSNPTEYTTWYNAVKDFDFQGWCIGGASSKLADFMFVIALMLKNREFEKDRNKWVHLLGASKISDYFILAELQKQLNKLTDGRITLSTDSSSPGQYPIFGQMVYDIDFRNLAYKLFYFSKSTGVKYPKEGFVPSVINHPGVPYLTWDLVEQFKTETMLRMAYHNVHAFNWIFKRINDLVYECPMETMIDIIPSDLQIVLKSIGEMFESDDPIVVFEKYRQVYVKFGGETIVNTSKNIQTEFFDFDNI